MASQTRIIPQENPLQGLDDLMFLIKNPDKYEAAQGKLREQLQLTAEAQQKLADAKAFIAEYEAKKKELDAGFADLADQKEAHAQTVADDQAAAKAVSDQLDARRDELKATTLLQAETDKAQVQIANENAAYKKQLDDEYAEKVAALEDRESAVTDGINGNNTEAERLAKIRETLEAKAAFYKQAEAI